MVDLVGMEPTTFPASRDALTVSASAVEPRSALGLNGATSNFSAAVPGDVPEPGFRTPRDRPISKVPGRGSKLFAHADALLTESRPHRRSQCKTALYFRSLGCRRK